MRTLTKRRPSPAMVVAVIALIVALAGTAYAATETVSLGFKEDTGPEPAPLFEPAAVESANMFMAGWLDRLAETAARAS